MSSNILSKVEKYSIWLTLSLVPLVILPIFSNPFVTGKITILVIGVLIAITAKALRMIMEGHLRLSGGIFDLSVIILAVAYVFSAITTTPNKMEAVLLPGSATLVLFSAILYLLINQLDDQDKRKTRYFLLVPAVIPSILSFMSVSGVLAGISSLPAYIRAASFSLIGGSLAATIYLLAIVPMAANLTIKEKDMAKKTIFGIATIVVLMGFLSSGYDAFVGSRQTTALPTFRSSWYIAVDSLKENPLTGVGPGNYLTAYNRFRPLSDNMTESWQTRFTTARSFYLTVITEAGLLGIGGLVFMLITLYALLKRDSTSNKLVSLDMLINDNFMSLVVLLIALIFFPAFPAVIVLLFALLSLGIKSHRLNLGWMPPQADTENEDGEQEEKPKTVNKMPFILLALPLLIFVAYSGFHTGRILIAEATYKNALDAVASNDGKNAYDLLRNAINLNTGVDRYRVTYAQINLLLANNMATKKDLSDQDKQTISSLIEQAIREGKAAVALNPQRASNWETLATIYKSVINLAKGADAFAVQTYTQAIVLDPGNVNTRIALGGIYFAAKNYPAAIDTFKLAVLAKTDFANSRYNLAVAYRDSGDYDRAIAEMERVVTLVKRDSEDYKIAMKELEDLKANKPGTGTPSGEGLGVDTPQKSNQQKIVDLGEEENPPQPQVTPSASPKPVLTATPVATTSPSSTPQP